jgi:protoporphyrinogen oxidase
MNAKSEIYILGGGPAGLSAGYFAKKQGLDFTILEAGTQVGGNLRTLQQGAFLFDTGGHRFHDKDPEVTQEIKGLLGKDLFEVRAPSEIFYDGKFVRFPLRLSDLVKQLDCKTLVKIAWENLPPRRHPDAENFAELALSQYGPRLAEMFLLNYSRKLWGMAPHTLSTAVSGGRLKNLDLKNFMRELVLGPAPASSHLDGSFLYPKYGIGMISDKMSQFIGAERICPNSRVSRLVQKNKRIEQVELNGGRVLEVSTLINTLPLTLAAKMLDPPPPPELLAVVNTIRFRHLVLCVFGLDRPFFSSNASLYFSSEDLPFTRLYEPKNRSVHMAPQGQTAVVLELPCFNEDAVWTMGEGELRSLVWEGLQRVKPLGGKRLSVIRRIKCPSPILCWKWGLPRRWNTW